MLGIPIHISNPMRNAALWGRTHKSGILCRISKYVTLWSKLTYVQSVILPHFDYCATILLMASETQLLRLQRIQNKLMRVVLRCNRYTSVTLMLNTLQWLSVKQRIVYNCLIFIHKIKNEKLPQYLMDELQYGLEIHNHGTRRAADFRLPRCTRTSTQRTLFDKGLKIYNDLPQETKDTVNMSAFKRLITIFVKRNH